MNVIYIISQIFGFGAFFFSLFAYHNKKKEQILNFMVIHNVLNFFQYILLQAYSGCIIKVVAIMRDIFIIKKKNNSRLSSPIFLFIFILLYILVAIFTYNGIPSLFPVLSATLYLIPIWNGDEKTIRITGIATTVLWLIYNIFVHSIAGIVENSLFIISTAIALFNNK